MNFSQQSAPSFIGPETLNGNEFIARLFPMEEGYGARRDAEYFCDEFQKCGVCLSIHSGCCDFHFHGIAVFAGDFVALCVGNDPQL